MAGRLLYDADCAFCTRSAQWAQRRRLGADIVPLQSVDLVALGVDPVRATREIPFAGPDGVVYGHVAISAALRTGGFAWRVIGRLLTAPLISPLAAACYRLVAAQRHRLPGGTAACELPPAASD